MKKISFVIKTVKDNSVKITDVDLRAMNRRFPSVSKLVDDNTLRFDIPTKEIKNGKYTDPSTGKAWQFNNTEEIEMIKKFNPDLQDIETQLEEEKYSDVA